MKKPFLSEKDKKRDWFDEYLKLIKIMKYFIFVLLFFFCESQDNDKISFKTENYKVHSPFIPNNLDFCNEKVPIEYQDILEEFDKEIIVNTHIFTQKEY